MEEGQLNNSNQSNNTSIVSIVILGVLVLAILALSFIYFKPFKQEGGLETESNKSIVRKESGELPVGITGDFLVAEDAIILDSYEADADGRRQATLVYRTELTQPEVFNLYVDLLITDGWVVNQEEVDWIEKDGVSIPNREKINMKKDSAFLDIYFDRSHEPDYIIVFLNMFNSISI